MRSLGWAASSDSLAGDAHEALRPGELVDRWERERERRRLEGACLGEARPTPETAHSGCGGAEGDPPREAF